MYTVTYRDGTTYRGENYRIVLRHVISSSPFSMWQECNDYMKDVAWRIEILEDKYIPIRTDCPEKFFQDLLKLGYLRKMGLEN